MIKTSLKSFFLFILITCANKLYAQKKFDVNIQIPTSLKSKGFLINYDDGVKTYAVTDSFIKNRLEFNGKFESEYATLTIKYTVNDSISFEDSYFIGTKPVEFDFLSDSSTLNKNPFKNCNIRNALEIDQSKMSIKRGVYSKDAINQMNIFWKNNASLVGRVDSITQKFYNNLDYVDRKDLEFIKKNRDNYYSFWRFRTQIVPNTLLVHKHDSVEIEKLLNLLNTVFPKKYTSTPEGQNLQRLLEGKLFFKKNTLVGSSVPDFQFSDVNGNKDNLYNIQSPFKLINFWASWCGPCLAELPELKAFQVSNKNVAIISFSIDYDKASWIKSSKENEIPWYSFSDSRGPEGKFASYFSVQQIPLMILLDGNNKIIKYDVKIGELKKYIETK